MINQTMYRLGSARSCIRELYEYGLKQAELVGQENVYDYSLGNPSIPSPALVNDTIVAEIGRQTSLDLHGYTPAAGMMPARKAIAENLNSRFACGARASDVFITCGAAAGLISAVRALSVENAEVLAIAPFFPEYRPFVENAGCSFDVIPADREHFQIDLDALKARICEHTQAIIVNSPNNPAGTVYTAETISALAAILREASAKFGHPIYLLADEPYRELVYDGVQVPFIPNLYENTVVCYSWSKSLSLPGERIGYVYVSPRCADHDALFAAIAGAARILGHVCPPSLMQRVITACVACPPDLAAYERNRALLYHSLLDMGYSVAKPDGAFYLFVKAPNGDGNAFSELAKQDNLLIVPGKDFGCSDYFRICYCVDYEMIQKSLPIFKKLIQPYR